MSARNACLTDERFRALLAGTAAELERRESEAHLTECVACRERLDALAGGAALPFEKWPRPSAMPDSKPLRDAMARLKAGTGATHTGVEAAPPLPGAKLHYLGDYEILEELGRGGMGVVYRARQLSLRREVALKVMLTGQLASPAEIQRFQVEAEAAARLDHPNIVPIYEIGEHEGHHFFSMKLVEGGPLSARISDSKSQFSTLEAARLLACVARAVHYAHQRGVLHRDLKPGNILIDGAGDPHVTDFGLAKLVEHDSSLTRSAAIMGTPNYMAPETAAGHARDATTAADVYSLGAIFYEMLTGRPPFQAESVAQTVRQVIEEEPASPASLNAVVPADLATICLKCLEKDPARRYASAAVLADELERFRRGEPILARPVTQAERLWRWCKRKPALAATLATLLLVFASGLAGIIWQWQRAESFARNESAQRNRAETESEHSRQTVTRLEIERAESLVQSGASSEGLARLARLIRREPANQVVATRLISALGFRSFCLPVAPLSHESPLPLADGPPGAGDNPTAPFRAAPVVSPTFSSDGQYVLTVGKDGSVQLWNGMTGEQLVPSLKHEAPVLRADFSPNGLWIVTACRDGTARVWSRASGEPASPPLRHGGAVRFAAFSPDSRRIVTASDDGTARIWEVPAGEPVGPPFQHETPVYFAGFSPDGHQLLTAQMSRSVWLLDVETREIVASLNQEFRPETPTPFPLFVDGDHIMTVRRQEAEIRSLKSANDAPIRVRHDEAILAFVSSADGRRVATASHDATVQVWETATGQAVGSPLRHGHSVLALQFSDDGRRLLTGSHDRNARLWDVSHAREVAEPMWHDGAVIGTAIAPGGRRLATVTGRGEAWLWAVRNAQFSAINLRHETGVDLARFSRDGRKIVTASRPRPGTPDGTAQVWDAISGQLLAVIHHPRPQPVLFADFSPDGQFIVTATAQGNARRWNATNAEPAGPPLSNQSQPGRGGRRPMRMVRFSPDGQRVVTASDDGTVYLWDPATAVVIHEWNFPDRVTSASFSPDGRVVLTASRNGTACFWNAETGERIQEPLMHDHSVDWAEFDPTGRIVATAARQIRLWSVATGQLIVPPLIYANPLAEGCPFDFNSNGTRIATAAGGTLQIWSVATGKSITPSIEHGARIRAVRYSPRGEYVVTACDDGVARIWDATTGHLACEPFRHEGAVTYAEFDPDGVRLLTCSADGSARIWPVVFPPVPVPGWLPVLVEALSGQQMDDQDVNRVSSVAALHRVIRSVKAAPSSDFYGHWASGFFAESATPTHSP